MAINKVTFDGNTLIDLTSDTVDPSTLGLGVTAHDKAGNAIVGTAEIGGGYDKGYEEGFQNGRDEGYNHGYEDGETDGYNKAYPEGVEAGKQAEYDARWDNIQQNGNRIGGIMLFAGVGWNSENFKPKYKIIIGESIYPYYSDSMFERFDNLLKYPSLEITEDMIDFSRATILTTTFKNANISKVEMNCIPPNLTRMTGTFWMNSIASHKLKTLKLGVNENTTFDSYTFVCSSIENVSFIEGSIIGNDITFSKAAGLTRESIVNIVNVLSLNVTGKTLSLSLAAVNKAFETSEGANDGSTSKEWLDLLSAYDNWTISLA